MAGLFVYSWIQDRSKTNKTLEELSKSNVNIADALNILKMSYDLQREQMQEHERKTEIIQQDIKEIKVIVNK
ncbi:MAG: hypothetical protein PHH22_01470 [Clostridia bacterium]|nr:hypothetical protein [Clostridia bacterium]